MEAAWTILRHGSILFLPIEYLHLGLDLFFSGLVLDYPDVSLGHRRADLTLRLVCELDELAPLPSASKRTAR